MKCLVAPTEKGVSEQHLEELQFKEKVQNIILICKSSSRKKVNHCLKTFYCPQKLSALFYYSKFCTHIKQAAYSSHLAVVS